MRPVKSSCKVTVEAAAGGEKRTLDADIVLVAIGRRPFTDGLGLETVGIATDKRGATNVQRPVDEVAASKEKEIMEL